jgi:hypothetical protein
MQWGKNKTNFKKTVKTKILSAAALCLIGGCAQKSVTLPAPPAPILETGGKCPGAVAHKNIRVTMSTGGSNYPEILWDKEVFNIAWWDMRSTEPEIYTVGLSREGYEVRTLKKIPSNGWAKNPTMAFDGIETHLVWWEEPRVLSARLKNGDPEIRILANNGAQPTAAAWGGAAWVSAGLLYFVSDGMINLKTGAPLPPKVIAAGGIESPKISYNGIFYTITWSESVPNGRRIVLQRVSPQGKKLGNLLTVSTAPGQHKSPATAWNGGQFAATWTSIKQKDTNKHTDDAAENPFQIFWALIPEVGNAPTVSRPLPLYSAAGQPALASSGEEYALAWLQRKKGGGYGIYFQRLDTKGELVGAPLEVTDASPHSCSRPSITWDGQGYAVAWHDDREHHESEIYFSYISCKGEDIGIPAVKQAPPPPDDADLPSLKEAF